MMQVTPFRGSFRGGAVLLPPALMPRILPAPLFMPRRRGVRGMGATTTSEVLGASNAAGQIASVASSSLPLSTQIEASSAAALVAAAPFAGPAAPFLLIGAGIASLMATFKIGAGCGQKCVISTQFANQANAALQNNIETYFALPTPRPLSAQTAALNNFDSLWAWLQQKCSDPNLGDPGRRCITDRQAGACTWKQPASSVPPWGTPAAGACWNWFNGYRDPVASDTNVYDDSTMTQAQAQAAASGASTATATTAASPWLWLGAGALLLLAFGGVN